MAVEPNDVLKAQVLLRALGDAAKHGRGLWIVPITFGIRRGVQFATRPQEVILANALSKEKPFKLRNLFKDLDENEFSALVEDTKAGGRMLDDLVYEKKDQIPEGHRLIRSLDRSYLGAGMVGSAAAGLARKFNPFRSIRRDIAGIRKNLRDGSKGGPGSGNHGHNGRPGGGSYGKDDPEFDRDPSSETGLQLTSSGFMPKDRLESLRAIPAPSSISSRTPAVIIQEIERAKIPDYDEVGDIRGYRQTLTARVINKIDMDLEAAQRIYASTVEGNNAMFWQLQGQITGQDNGFDDEVANVAWMDRMISSDVYNGQPAYAQLTGPEVSALPSGFASAWEDQRPNSTPITLNAGNTLLGARVADGMASGMISTYNPGVLQLGAGT